MPATERAIQRLVDREGATVTDAVLRLVRYGAVVDAALVDGCDVLVRRDGQMERLRVLC